MNKAIKMRDVIPNDKPVKPEDVKKFRKNYDKRIAMEEQLEKEAEKEADATE